MSREKAVSEKKPDREATEGWESLVEEASEGSLTPSAELEQAMREAAEAVEAREAARHPSAGEGPESAEVESLRQELEEFRDKHIRLQADFENFRRRTLRERQEAHQFGHENLVKDLLATVDNLERAIEHARNSRAGDQEGLLRGVELVQRELMGVLAKHGVSVIQAEGKAFDPSFHEAMVQMDDDTVPENTVMQELQRGYRLHDRLLRPARVVVSKRAGEEQEATPDSKAEKKPQREP